MPEFGTPFFSACTLCRYVNGPAGTAQKSCGKTSRLGISIMRNTLNPLKSGSCLSTIALLNLGCAKNRVDGERMLASFAECGYTIVADFKDAEIIIVNTCAFIQEAREETIESILEMASFKNSGRCRCLAVAGCFSQRYRDQAKRDLPEVDLWLSLDRWQQEFGRRFRYPVPSTFLRALQSPRATQYMKISDGCSQRCSFCAIPHIRGPFTSRTCRSCLEEARWLEEQGVRECILVSQDTTSYGVDKGLSLAHLLEQLLKHTQFPWIRLMYLYPGRVDDSLLRLIGSEPRLCSYFDIPLQHINDTILRSMKRRPGDRGIRTLIDKIRKYVDSPTLRTSFILGYPGETSREFDELLRFAEHTKFDRVGVFPFSPEEGTAAYKIRPRPRKSTALKRCERLMEMQREISADKLFHRRGQCCEVIIDGKLSMYAYAWTGRTRGDAPEIDGNVFIQNGNYRPGDIVTVSIAGSDDHDLYA
ncbi:MAG: 30S ribosomal protein S12 methylthiotransferase RimO [Chitinivibrionales bacterium]|nr:30S ribosomal protein S12 methylthiotransferase RimO [Chitinivibrionales bacterium]